MSIRIAVIQFPGSNCDRDATHVLNNVIGIQADLIWHTNFKERKYDGCILPGGFSFGDYLRGGIIAAHSPAVKEAEIMLKDGRPVLGICNGFQILTEAEFLPGALLRNNTLKFECKWVHIRVENNETAFSNQMKKKEIIDIPIAHSEGRYFYDNLKELYDNDQIVFKYVSKEGLLNEESNPNGSFDNIAGVCNLERNCVGLMPHPERASEEILSPFKNTHGIKLFNSMVNFIKSKVI